MEARGLLLLPAAALVALSVWLLVRPALVSPVPGEAEWLEAARHVRDRWREGDVVRIEPSWLTAGRVFFGDVDGGPREPMRILDLHDPPDPLFLYRFRRVWVVAAAEARTANEGSLAPPGAGLVERTELGPISVFLFDLPEGMLHWEMLAALPGAEVERSDGGGGKDGRSVSCRWNGAAHRCVLDSLPLSGMDVAVELRRVAGSARRCVLVRPGPGVGPVALRFPGLPGAGELRIRAGNTVEAARSKDGGPVDVVVRVDGEEAGRVRLERRSYRLEEIRWPLRGGEVLLEVEIAAGDILKREVCLDGYVVECRVTSDE